MNANNHGFTLVEILVALVTIGVLAGIGIVTLTGVREDSRRKKLEQDVVVVNNAIDAFLVAGGSIGQLTEGNVIAALKQRVVAPGPGDMVGPQGPFLDLTVITNASDFDWSAVFSTSPSPHFVVVNSPNGVVFGHGPASAVGGVGEREDAARTEWVWAYSNAAPPVLPDAFVPEAVDSAYTGGGGVPVTTLVCPIISPGSLSTNLWGFPLSVTIENPNPAGSSRVYYKVNAGSYTLYDGTPLDVGPGTVLTAVAVSLDPSRYNNSDGCDGASYQVIPFPLEVNIVAPSSMTYAQAGGLMTNQAQQSPATAVLNIQNVGQIPPPYLGSGNFNVRYTLDGSDPLTSETAVVGPSFQGYYSPVAISLGLDTWGTNASLQIRAVALASNTNWFVSSDEADASVTAERLTLDVPTVAPGNQIVSPSVEVSMTKPSFGPVGMEIQYTTNNTVPAWGNGILYSGNFILAAFGANEERFVQAATFPGATDNFMTNWFLPSGAVVRTYTGAAGFGSSLPSGVLVGYASVGNSGHLRGSMIVARGVPVANIVFSGAGVISGNLYVPGTPNVYKYNTSAANRWSSASDSSFSSFILGQEFDADGNVVSPSSPGWSPSPRVVDLNGDPAPTNYHILLANSSRVDGKIFRRADAPTLPTVDPPPTKANNSSTSYGWGVKATVNPAAPQNSPASFTAASNAEITLQPGNYGQVKAQNTGKLILGDASNPENVQYYTFESLELSGSSTLEVVGKVVITINYSASGKPFATSNSAIVGNADHPEYLQINVYSSAAANQNTIHVNVSGAGSFYGQINAPKGQAKVGNSGSFRGSVTAYKMDMSGAGGADIEFNLPPIFSP